MNKLRYNIAGKASKYGFCDVSQIKKRPALEPATLRGTSLVDAAPRQLRPMRVSSGVGLLMFLKGKLAGGELTHTLVNLAKGGQQCVSWNSLRYSLSPSISADYRLLVRQPETLETRAETAADVDNGTLRSMLATFWIKRRFYSIVADSLPTNSSYGGIRHKAVIMITIIVVTHLDYLSSLQHASPVSMCGADYEAPPIHDNLIQRRMTTSHTHNCIQYRLPSLRIVTARPVSMCEADYEASPIHGDLI
ncbi:hypothetical protein CSKR_113931 [Clonorchis sinensis]|uniref:Uncharacterized protein n=1 Tax=Clonorchis sinensis TaxID=79923 RepID=A0A3R7H9M8_CLOSI|nr:hypothetical protein CSKR_113931 [Clonorchis sinensis]